MNPNLVVIPTRDRPHNAQRAFEQLKKVSVESDFLMIINEDQFEMYSSIKHIPFYDVPSELGSIGKVNYVLEDSPSILSQYQTITGIDDDCMVTTPEWDAHLLAPIKRRGYGISYGNDTMQGENLPTKVMISTNILKPLGFWAPPVLTHLFADNFWKELGTALAALTYFPNVMMEHWHYLNGKAPIDELYQSIYRAGEMENAQDAFTGYMKEDFARDVERVKLALAG